MESPFKMAHDFEARVRKELETVKFRWDLYFPRYFLADVAILVAIVSFIVWFLR